MESSHFSFTSNLYDKCNLEQKNKESAGPFHWMTDHVKESNSKCYQQQSPFIHNTFANIPSSNVDISSDLRGQTRLLSRCPEKKFKSGCLKCNENGLLMCDECKANIMFKDCPTDALVPEYTRIKRPCDILSGININRFHPLTEDLQEAHKIHMNSYIGMNTRNNVKDAWENKN